MLMSSQASAFMGSGIGPLLKIICAHGLGTFKTTPLDSVHEYLYHFSFIHTVFLYYESS
jgi:hypothetical protein